MDFLIDADLPQACVGVLHEFGHRASTAASAGLGTAPDSLIAQFAKANRAAILTGDFDFADTRNYPPEDYFGLVVLALPRDATRRVILDMLRSFLSQAAIVEAIPGRLAVVEFGRVRLRPPIGP